MLFVGQTRFSLFRPKDPSWRLSQKQNELSEEAYRAKLYDDERLALRSEIFLKHTVPTLQIAADRSGHEVIHLVSYSESLPTKYRKMLENAATIYPVLCLDPRKDCQMGSNPAEIARSKVQAGEVFGIYRLDDDDILPITFFEQVVDYIKPEMVGMLISLPRGIEAIAFQGGLYDLREGYYPMHSLGLMQVCELDTKGTLKRPLPSPHDKSDRRNPVIIDSRNLGYFRINHTGQDHRLRSGSQNDLTQVLNQMRRFEKWEDHRVIEDLFPTLTGITAWKDPWGERDERPGVVGRGTSKLRFLFEKARRLRSKKLKLPVAQKYLEV